MVRKKGFNLLKTQVEPQTVWTKLYRWTTTTARAIMVLVELVIVVAFGIRVVVDLQFKNLNKDIESQESIMLIMKESEQRLRDTQEKVKLYKSIWEDTDYYSNVYIEVIRIVPTSVRDLTFQLNEDELVVKGFADINTVEKIEGDFKNSSLFINTELLNFETQGNSADSFTIKTNFNNLPKRSEILY